MPGIGAAVLAAMEADTTLNALLPGGTWPADAVNEDSEGDFAEFVVTRDDDDRDLSDTLLGYQAEVTVSFLTATYKAGQNLLREGRRVLNGMKGQTLASKTIDSARVTDGSDTPQGPVERDDQQTFQSDLTVSIYYRE